MSNWRRTRQPGPELFAFENAGRVILDPLADHDLAADVHQIEHPAHRVAGRRVGFFLFAAAEPGKRIQRRRLGRAHEIELDDALDVVIILLAKFHRDILHLRERSASCDARATSALALALDC